MKTQYEMFYDAQRKNAEKNIFFMEMINDAKNPLTNKDLEKLIKAHPERYSCYSAFLGKLKD